MIHNIPHHYTREMLTQYLDYGGFEGRYDFVHMPINRSTRDNAGYAFVNFVDDIIAASATKYFESHPFEKSHNYRWNRTPPLPWVSPAYLQGLRKNMEHYQNTSS